MLPSIVSIIIGYLLGSIPTAYAISRVRKGIDIRNVGSGNMGAANVMREIGTHEGVFVGLIDTAKGAGAILVAQALNVSELWVFGTGFAALVGHNFPVFARFRGGRGSATIIGIFLVLAPKATLAMLAVVAIPFFTTRKFTGALIIAFAFLPPLIWLLEGSLTLVRYALIVEAFMLIRNLGSIRQVVAKGIIKDMVYDKQGKEPKR
ncbi:MAG: glycerol-3-phosphate acyltransferase [Dehalococcoidia bacterium]